MKQIRLEDLETEAQFAQINDPLQMVQTIKGSNCSRCPRSLFRQQYPKQQITVSRGNPEASVWIVGKSPGMKDGAEGVPFSFGSGDLLRDMLHDIGLNWETDCFLINPVFCAEEGDKTPTVGEMDACSIHLDHLVRIGRPKFFIALGATAHRALTGRAGNMDELSRGTATVSRYGQPVYTIYHPAYFFKDRPDVEEAKRMSVATLDNFKAALHGQERNT